MRIKDEQRRKTITITCRVSETSINAEEIRDPISNKLFGRFLPDKGFEIANKGIVMVMRYLENGTREYEWTFTEDYIMKFKKKLPIAHSI